MRHGHLLLAGQRTDMAKGIVIVAVVTSKGERISKGENSLCFHHPEESFGVKVSQIAHPLCVTDAHLHGENSKFWLMQKLAHQDRGSERETVRHQGAETEQVMK